MKPNIKTYVCRKIRLCTYLLEKGFEYMEEKPDVFKPNRKVWIFEETPSLRNAIEEYYSLIPG